MLIRGSQIECQFAGATRDADLDNSWMNEALAEAHAAEAEGEIPVGCVIVGPLGGLMGRGHNERERARDPTAHAEMLAIRAATRHSVSWRLDGATAYVTLEPCAMCAGALVLARVARVVYGCDDRKAGALRSLFSIGSDQRLNHVFEVRGGVLGDVCAERLSGFFRRLRASRRGP
ncbi:MAG: nucleoside deaminase [Myxococcales bacterium]|jgi:tRNA(adenine34) deaminase